MVQKLECGQIGESPKDTPVAEDVREDIDSVNAPTILFNFETWSNSARSRVVGFCFGFCCRYRIVVAHAGKVLSLLSIMFCGLRQLKKEIRNEEVPGEQGNPGQCLRYSALEPICGRFRGASKHSPNSQRRQGKEAHGPL